MIIKKYITKAKSGWHSCDLSDSEGDRSWMERASVRAGINTLLLCRSDSNISGEMEGAFVRLSFYPHRKEVKK